MSVKLFWNECTLPIQSCLTKCGQIKRNHCLASTRCYNIAAPEPLIIMALSIQMLTTAPGGFPKRFDSSTAASVVWSARTSSPTGSVPVLEFKGKPIAPPADFSENMESSLAWSSLAQTILADSRPMKDWERESLDAFTWAELEA